MKKFIYLLGFFSIMSCAKEWSTSDQNQYRQDCLSTAAEVENLERICDCGLQKAMENYKNLEDAQKAIQNMSEQEVENFFAECM